MRPGLTSGALLWQVEVILRAFPTGAAAAAAARGEGTPPEEASAGPLQDGLRHLLDAPKEALIEAERSFLTRALALLQVHCPFPPLP